MAQREECRASSLKRKQNTQHKKMCCVFVFAAGFQPASHPRRYYFSVGTTIPLMIIFWQKTNTIRVGIAATASAAKPTAGAALC